MGKVMYRTMGKVLHQTMTSNGMGKVTGSPAMEEIFVLAIECPLYGKTWIGWMFGEDASQARRGLPLTRQV